MNKKKPFFILILILLPFFLLLLSYQLFFHFSSYSPSQKKVIAFLENKGPLPANLTKAEISHLVDVKNLKEKTTFLFYFLFFLLLFSFAFYLPGKKKNQISSLLLFSGLLTFLLLSFFLILVLIDFDFVFILFHQIFFPQGNWSFGENTFLIQTFPQSFFFSFTKKTFFLTFFWASLFILSSLFLKKNKNPKTSP